MPVINDDALCGGGKRHGERHGRSTVLDSESAQARHGVLTPVAFECTATMSIAATLATAPRHCGTRNRRGGRCGPRTRDCRRRCLTRPHEHPQPVTPTCQHQLTPPMQVPGCSTNSRTTATEAPYGAGQLTQHSASADYNNHRTSTAHYLPLPLTAVHKRPLLHTTRTLPAHTTAHYCTLPLTAAHYFTLPLTSAHYR